MEEKIFCLGRPILDINVNIKKSEWQELNKNSLISSDNLLDHLESLKLRADYSISAGGVESNLAINCALLGLPSILAEQWVMIFYP